MHEVPLIAGEWDMVVKVRGRNLEDIGKLVLEKMRKIDGAGRTYKLGCFETITEGH